MPRNWTGQVKSIVPKTNKTNQKKGKRPAYTGSRFLSRKLRTMRWDPTCHDGTHLYGGSLSSPRNSIAKERQAPQRGRPSPRGGVRQNVNKLSSCPSQRAWRSISCRNGTMFFSPFFFANFPNRRSPHEVIGSEMEKCHGPRGTEMVPRGWVERGSIPMRCHARQGKSVHNMQDGYELAGAHQCAISQVSESWKCREARLWSISCICNNI